MNPWLESTIGLVLLDPWLLLLGAGVLVSEIVHRRRGAPAVRFAPATFLAAATEIDRGTSATRSWRVRAAGLPRLLRVAGLLLLVIALARPAERVRRPSTTAGIDILLCLDVSSSMAARDLDPQRQRLEVAKAAAQDFIAGRPEDRIGLVCFARYPDLRCPLTLDHVALRDFLDQVGMVERDGLEDATGIGTAVARAAQVLGESAARSKVVILLTDGEENVATARNYDEIAPVHAGQLAKDLGVRVYSIAAGIGTRAPGGVGRIDTVQIERVAEKTGGRFYAAKDAGAVRDVYAAISGLEKVVFEEARYEIAERFLGFLIASLILLGLGRGLESTALEVLP
ncbi:MAG: aerotolerance regulator BatA [Planctomycetes bacterium]|nr:aerotolerance regulator BatA [Planctomycetota bacterium]